ncbi:beta-N-acetylhexosaminidase [Dethiosulfatarculus sandiegensis]|nr:beta-N-acetylhexosaminidase [Dethiosulfatarculus sandiegensis]
MMSPEEIRAALAQSFVVGLQGPTPLAEELEMVGDKGLGGVILFKRNCEGPEQVWRLNRDLRRAAEQAGNPTLFAMVDQEGGTVARLKGDFTHDPDFCELGDKDEKALYDHGLRLGRELSLAGFNWNLAPVLDVHGLPDGVMARRSLGSDPQVVGRLGAAYIKGQQKAGVLACGKHFPGLGRTTKDTHKERPIVDLSAPELAAMELIPFERAIQAESAGIMVCHAVFSSIDPTLPASLSPKISEGLLRRQMGFKGLILSDDLEMGALAANLDPAGAAVKAYQAGVDLLLICHRAEYALAALDELVDKALKRQISQERIQKGLKRILTYKENLPARFPELAELNQALKA